MSGVAAHDEKQAAELAKKDPAVGSLDVMREKTAAEGSADKDKIENKLDEKEDKKGLGLSASKKHVPYPDVKEATPSEKKRKKDEIEKEKADMIRRGEFQSRSDEDETLEKVKSLEMEQSEKPTTKKSKM